MIYFQGNPELLNQIGILETFVLFTASTTYTMPYNGPALWIAIGGGGSGAHVVGGAINKAAGGGAGGLSYKRLIATQGQTFTVTVGSGGAAITGGAGAGNAGVASSVVGTGISISAGGGGGGGASQTAAVANGGAGGTATGGDVTYTGGAGGSILNAQAVPVNVMQFGAGGGAVNVCGIASRGGNLDDAALSSGADSQYATGGAGINTASGVIDVTSYTGSSVLTVGGGATGQTNAVQPAFGLTLFGFPISVILGSQAFTGGNSGNVGAAGNNFAGGGGVALGVFGTASAGRGGYGGGGGGAAARLGGGAGSGAGGQGIVLLAIRRTN